jgi:hypothetical protein
MTTIKVVDSIMGSGKTSAAINLMNSDTQHNFIYITPYLSEVERIKQSTIHKFYEPKIYSKHGELHTKFDSLHELLAHEKNIVSTHALFKRANEETKELIQAGNYILILDEVMNVVEQLDIKKDDLNMLLETKCIYIEDGFIKWNTEKKDYDTRYNDIKDMAMNNTLIYFRDTVLIWTFPVSVFKAFKEVYILTYLFDAQIQKYYYDLYNLQYEKYIATKENDTYIFKKNIGYSDKEIKESLKTKIHIYEGNLNDIGKDEHALSKSWYQKKTKPVLEKLKNNITNYFKHKVKANSDEAMWTTFKDYKDKLKGRGYTKGYVSSTARATNEYKHKNKLVYPINRFVNPIIYGFFEEKGIHINQNLFALSEMLQWIWRSAIRDDKEIYIYIPSSRMRSLLNKWLNDEY